MNIITWLSRLGERRRRNSAIATRVLSDLRAHPDDPFAADPLLTDAIAERNPHSQADQRALVDVALRLPLRQRQILDAYTNGYTPQEIAKALDITTAVVFREHAKALAVLRECGE